MAVPTGRESDKFMLRLPDGMRDRIKAAAEHNGRSMNAEINATLEKAYPEPIDPATIKFISAFEFLEQIRKARTREAAIHGMNELNSTLSLNRSSMRVTFGNPVKNSDGTFNIIVVNLDDPDCPPW